MTAVLRHSQRSASAWLIKVHPNDGRYMEEFKISTPELRRFAWAVLADLDPEEAQAAAREEGLDLADLTRPLHPVKGRPPGAEGAERACAPPKPGTKKYRVLCMLAEGLHTSAALKAQAPDIKNLEALLWELRQGGFVRRLNEPHAIPALHGLTPTGRAVTPAPAPTQSSVAA